MTQTCSPALYFFCILKPVNHYNLSCILMPDPSSVNNDFLKKLKELIEENLSDDRFGVSELAAKAGMSRSNLLRRVNKLTGLSASQFIRNVRLEDAMGLLQEGSYNVSEIAFRVGFSSSSYFIKCFREHYGYPPGEAGKRDLSGPEAHLTTSVQPSPEGGSRRRRILLAGAAVVLIACTVILLILVQPLKGREREAIKSIAVLPFKNESTDSSNIYLVNGLMESVLNDLQKIEDLRVISRTSAEKYRHTDMTVPEIARELNVEYIIEGSGQKSGDQIVLNVQLIDAGDDKHLWANRYTRDANDIFTLQAEVARQIADAIEVIITPDVEQRINRTPTENPVAYDYFMKGLDKFYQGDKAGLDEAIEYFKKAIGEDDQFARAYADIAISYFLLDAYLAEKQYIEEINFYADRALLLDPELAQSLAAKAMYYIDLRDYQPALPYLKKALELNPNSVMVINLLSEYYASYVPDTEKYLMYALKGINLDIAGQDSSDASVIYLHVSNAFAQSGFTDEAEKYINLSIDYDPDNIYSAYVRAYILFARDGNLRKLRDRLIKVLNRDPSRIDVLQETGKICYYMRDYEQAWIYYKKFIEIREALNLDVYRYENAKIGVVLSEIGMKEEAEKYFADYLHYAEMDQSIYRQLSLAVYDAWTDKREQALEHLRLFLLNEHYHYWTILFLEIDPLVDHIKHWPEFRKIMNDMEMKFREYHQQIQATLEAEGLI